MRIHNLGAHSAYGSRVPAPDSASSAFKRVRDVIPQDQELFNVTDDADVTGVLAVMRASNFSQVPVVAGTSVLGVFSYRSFSRRLEINPTLVQRGFQTLVVEDFLEEVSILRLDDRLEALMAALDRDGCVLAGDPDDLVAVITESDLARFLLELGRSYVLLREIELGLRYLVSQAVDAETLAECAKLALAQRYAGRLDHLPTELHLMTLDEQISIVIDGRNFDKFSGVFGVNRDAITLELKPLPDLRNAVFHFRADEDQSEVARLLQASQWVSRRARRLAARRAVGALA